MVLLVWPYTIVIAKGLCPNDQAKTVQLVARSQSLRGERTLRKLLNMQFFGPRRFTGLLFAIAMVTAPVIAKQPIAQPESEEVFRFPAERNGFTRQTSDASELTDIFARADYLKKIAGNDISVKVDIVHLLEMAPTEHFAIRRANLSNEYPGLELKQQGEYRMKNLPPRSGYFGRFERIHHGTKEAIGVWTFDLGDWDVYIKARYPANSKSKAEGEITKFLSSLDWRQLQKMRRDDAIE
jgi:hypothetical protein